MMVIYYSYSDVLSAVFVLLWKFGVDMFQAHGA